MKRCITFVLALLVGFAAMSQFSFSNLRIPYSQKEVAEVDPDIIFFYDATLTSGDKKIKADGFDLGFYTNTYDILEANGDIDSIFVGTNEKQMAEIDSKDWIYSCDFYLNKRQLNKECAMLNIENVDGNCTLYINKKKVREYHNSFMHYRDNIKQYLKKGKNNIQLVFTPKDSIRMNQRAPQYLYGWDWHPKTLAPKINAIYLTLEDDVPFLDAKYVQTKSIEFEDVTELPLSAEMTLTLKFSKPLKEKRTLILGENKVEHMTFTLEPNATGEYVLDFSIEKPDLWWPNPGRSPLYREELWLKEDSLYLGTTTFGVRTIELVRDKDQYGESFYFKVNGKPVFAKGANYILTPVTKADDIIKANMANMNMLRIWGGADYGDGEFYNLCDEYGIMVWQDFPFACELYPADSAFLSNVEQEAMQNIQRISGHPSLALYCGNNEIWEGWHNWGWKDLVKDTIVAVEEYNKLFRTLLPNLVSKYAPTIDYIHSSPVEYGWGHEESRQIGDSHYWGVWWADSAFEAYTRKIPRFMSEYGFQSVMNQNTAEKYTTHPYTKANEAFAIHQKHDRGFELIDSRIHEWFGEYNNDDDYMFFSQAVQQEALKLAIEAHRRNKPYCMGSLFWQYNEPYPCVGWGCLDYSGEEKPVYYTAARSFEPIIFSIDKYSSKDSVHVYICSDVAEPVNMKYSLRILDENDSVRYIYIQDNVTIEANGTKKIASLAYKDIKSFNPKTDYLWVEGLYEDNIISNYSFFVYPKEYVSMEKYLEVIFDYYFGDNEDYELEEVTE